METQECIGFSLQSLARHQVIKPYIVYNQNVATWRTLFVRRAYMKHASFTAREEKKGRVEGGIIMSARS